MELNLNKIVENIKQNDFIENFIKELSNALLNYNKNNMKVNGENMNNIELTVEEELEFDKKEFEFLQEYFKTKLSDLSNGEIYIVTNKYENDDENQRYKVTQYKNNMECKYIAFEKDLPENVQLQDVVRKVNGKYIYDDEATRVYKSYYKQN